MVIDLFKLSGDFYNYNEFLIVHFYDKIIILFINLKKKLKKIK